MLKIRIAPESARRQKRRKKRRRVSRRRLAKIFLLLAIFLYGLFLLEEHIRPVILSIVDYESKRYALTAFNDAVAEMIEEEPEDYQGLYVITYAADGTIAAIQADTYAMNRLSSELTEKVEKKMNGLEDSSLSIPIGTLLGVQAMVGYGPRLKMHILPETYVRAQVYDSLEAAGINQTKLCVYVHYTMEMSVILSGYSACVTAENDICLSQVFLVGDVPQSYWGSSGVKGATGITSEK
jgi:sporulation protein YunB